MFSIFRVLGILCVAAPAAAQGLPGKPVPGAAPVGNSPEDATFIRAESTRWGKVVRDAGIRAD